MTCPHNHQDVEGCAEARATRAKRNADQAACSGEAQVVGGQVVGAPAVEDQAVEDQAVEGWDPE